MRRLYIMVSLVLILFHGASASAKSLPVSSNVDRGYAPVWIKAREVDHTYIDAVIGLEVQKMGYEEDPTPKIHDVILYKDGVPLSVMMGESSQPYEVLVGCIMTGRILLPFIDAYTDPGIYWITGFYEDTFFQTDEVYVEPGSIGDTPADARDMKGCQFYDSEGVIIGIIQIFQGRQELFSGQFLTDAKLLNGRENIPFSFSGTIFRKYDHIDDITIYTLFFQDQYYNESVTQFIAQYDEHTLSTNPPTGDGFTAPVTILLPAALLGMLTCIHPPRKKPRERRNVNRLSTEREWVILYDTVPGGLGSVSGA